MQRHALLHLREKVLRSNNKACFIERENLLRSHAPDTLALPEPERYRAEFELLLDNLSTPIEPDDVFLGRMVEARWPHPEPFSRVSGGLASEGHITLPMPTILTRGLAGIAADVSTHANRINSAEARYFERQALACLDAIRRFCRRYADAAERAGKTTAAAALRLVPWHPATDLFSALQSVWTMQFILSAVCGARDFAPGRLDQYLLPFLKADADSTPDLDQARWQLAFFLVKFNEITGTATENHDRKPIPCHASKQYLVLGGETAAGECQFNAVSRLLVEAAELVQLPQPTLNFRLGANLPDSAWRLVGQAARNITSQCNFFNDRLIVNRLLNAGILPDDAWGYSFTACNRVDLPGKLYNLMRRIDIFDNSLAWFREAILAAATESSAAGPVQDTLGHLRRIAEEKMLADIARNRVVLYREQPCFRLESLFFPSCIQSGRDIYRQGAENYRWMHRMFSGLANMADSLAAIKQLVEDEKRLSFPELVRILEEDFSGNEPLRQEIIRRGPHFGNADGAVDSLAADAANALIDAADAAGRKTGFIMMTSLYSLTHHAGFGAVIGATPDVRPAGAPVSENQSPQPGADRNSPTALLASVAALPLDRCVCGGLNLKFGSPPPADALATLVKSFFQLGGLHLGFTIVPRQTLEKARQNPQDYQTLTVRKTGFSEYFIALSPQEQQEIIDRTEYGS